MNRHLYELSHFRDEEAYERYLERIRRGKNYKFYKQLADVLFENGVSFVRGDILRLINIVDKEMNDRKAYRYNWYAADARRAIELVITEVGIRV